MNKFKAVLVENVSGTRTTRVRELYDADLPQGAVTVKVSFSGLNYKDALAITGRAPVIRKFPMVPGIDFAGIVEESRSTLVREGDHVLVNGWGLGETRWGGLAQRNRCDPNLVTALPAGLSLKQSMALGTAGYTAMLCVMALQKHGVKPSDGSIAITGAAGGVGSVAIMLMARLGYEVVAVSGRLQEAEYLTKLGAKEIVSRAEFTEQGKPLGKERWAGVIDSAGSHVLANLCATTRYGGVVVACGLAAGMDLHTSVAPFILRGISLVGVDSVMCPQERRVEAWKRLAEEIEPHLLDRVSAEVISLQDAIEVAPALLEGQVRGRIVVDVNKHD